MGKLITTIWCNHTAEEQGEFYASLLPDSRLEQVHRSPIDTPSGPAGQVLTVILTIAGQRFCLLNGGPIFPQTEAVSFMILTRTRRKRTGSGAPLSAMAARKARAAGARTNGASPGR